MTYGDNWLRMPNLLGNNGDGFEFRTNEWPV